MQDSAFVRRIVLVSGAPGSGKTTLGQPLAAALGMPFISKDAIKERLFDSLQGDPQRFGRSRHVVRGTAVGQLLGHRTSRQLGPVLEVDTTARVDVDALAAEVQSAFR